MKLEKLQGQTLSGRFRLDKLLGQGGYGAVFEAEQLSVGRRCAVKVLFPHLCGDEASVDRFRAEARSTSRLTHPNSIILYDFGRDEQKELLFLAMELLDGRDLTTVIQQQGLLSVEQAVHVAVQMSASLQEAHDLGLVHRDIKPRNVMLLERGNDPMFVKVIDFGIAKVVNSKLLTASDLTQTGTIIGTPKYMAPEQIRDSNIDGRTDMYAVAVSVYKMLTGRTPFEKGTALEIAGRQIAESPEPVSAFHPGLEVSQEFEQVLLKALAKEPQERFESVAAFARALVDAASGATAHMLEPGMTPTSLPQPTNTLPDDTPSAVQRQREQTNREQAEQPATGPLPGLQNYQEVTHTPQSGEVLSAPLPQPDATDTDEDQVATPTNTQNPTTGDFGADDFAEKTLATMAIPNAARPEAGEGTNRAGNTAEVEPNVDAPRSAEADDDTVPALQMPNLSVTHLAGLAAALIVLLGGIAWYASGGEGDDAEQVVAAATGEDDSQTLTANVAKSAGSEAKDEQSEVGDAAAKDEQPVEAEETKAEPAPEDQADVADEDAAAEADEAPADEASDEEQKDAEEAASDGKKAASPDETDEAAEQEEAPKKRVRRRRRSLEVRVIPWGTLYINGRKIGEGTRHTLKLREGRHRMVLKQDGEVRASRTVDVTSRSSKIIELVAR